MASEKPSLEGLRIDRAGDRGGGGPGAAVDRPGGDRRARPGGLGVARPAARRRGARGGGRGAGRGLRPAAGAVLNASGYVTARRQATVSSKITGKVVDVLVEEGMEIREGQVLAHLDDATPRKQLALAESQLASQRRSLAETEVRLRQAKLSQDADAAAARAGDLDPGRRRHRRRRRRRAGGAARPRRARTSRSPSASSPCAARTSTTP